MSHPWGEPALPRKTKHVGQGNAPHYTAGPGETSTKPIALDVAFRLKKGGLLKLAQALEPFRMMWLEAEILEKDGYLQLPDKPGLGTNVNEDSVAERPPADWRE